MCAELNTDSITSKEGEKLDLVRTMTVMVKTLGSILHSAIEMSVRI